MATGLVPARLGSQRLPGKALLDVGGQPLIARVLENAQRAESLCEVILATDDDAIAAVGREMGLRVALTDPNLPSGTDRIARAAEILDIQDEILVNIQGDEPEIAPSTIDAVVRLLENQEDCAMATAAAPLEDESARQNPNQVKVVTDLEGRALYFSRAPIPYPRDGLPSPGAGETNLGWGHIGLYAYRRDALRSLVALPPSPLEQIERLEQLRALQAGLRIGVALVDAAPPGIDTPDDLDALRGRWASREER